MRRWFGLAVIPWCTTAAAADPVFTSAPLEGALEYCVNDALNQAKLDEIMEAPDIPLGTYSGLKEVRTTPNKPGMVGIGASPNDGLTADEINNVIKSKASQFRGCYQRELAKNQKLRGKIVVRFRITERGTVGSASIASTTMKSAAVESCMLVQIKNLQFPAKATANVSYPFVFVDSE